MRSAKTEEILRRIKALNPAPPKPMKIAAPRDLGNLQEDLRQVLDDVGTEQYARVTARLFAPGGKYNRTRKHRYAIS